MEDVEFLDAYARTYGIGSRSYVLHLAIWRLRGAQLHSSYEAAWQEWGDSPESVDWAAGGIDPSGDPEAG